MLHCLASYCLQLWQALKFPNCKVLAEFLGIMMHLGTWGGRNIGTFYLSLWNNLKGFPKYARIEVLQREWDKPCLSVKKHSVWFYTAFTQEFFASAESDGEEQHKKTRGWGERGAQLRFSRRTWARRELGLQEQEEEYCEKTRKRSMCLEAVG